jgi:RNA polymerase sigma-70 factor, ECF subfamily
MNKEELLLLHSRIVNNDRGAFEKLYDFYAASLWLLVMRRVKDARTADRVLEKAFLAIWKDAPHCNPRKESLVQWMIGKCRQLAEAEMEPVH